jgi:uncharacterized alkaline shock family protein YloU
MAPERAPAKADADDQTTKTTKASSKQGDDDEAAKPSRGATKTTAHDGDAPGGLESKTGSTTISDDVVAKVVGLAAREVPGVHDLGGGASRAVGALTQMVGIGDANSQGVSVEVGETEAAADLTIVIEYGESIPKVAQQVRERVIARVEGITGLKVTEVNIEVNDLHFPGDDEKDDDEPRVQ